jgi:hypothetical protein
VFDGYKEASVIRLNCDSQGKSAVERDNPLTAGTLVLSREIRIERLELEDKVGLHLGEPADKSRSEPHALSVIPPNEVVPYRWSPKPWAIDTYIDALEYEVSQQWLHLRVRQREVCAAAARIKAHHGDFNALLWYAVAVMIGCLGWLSYIIYEAIY